ncbi:MAG: bestrophin family ion channel [Bergeyella zoohelcum]|nr:bestrophin family ion channel [Bergeyella zoohelcum]
MIIRERGSWLSMLFIWRGSVLKKILPQLLIITGFACLVLFVKGNIYDYKVKLNPAVFTLIGLALAIFMGFCNSASYDRFWEGRKLWGLLVIETRSLTRQITSLIPKADKEKQQQFVKMIAAFSWALNYQLRKKSNTETLERLLQKEDFERIKNKRFKPIAILDLMSERVYEQYQKGNIDSIILAQMDQQMNQFSHIVGACERIDNTPLPFAYKLLMHRTVYLYCFWLPFGLIDIVGLMMPVIVLLISYTFIALDAIIEEIGDPFGEEENDLALDTICKNIEFSIFEQVKIHQPPFPERNKNEIFFK